MYEVINISIIYIVCISHPPATHLQPALHGQVQRGLAGHGLGGVHVRGGVVQQHAHRARQVVLRGEVQRELAEIVRDVRVSLGTAAARADIY